MGKGKLFREAFSEFSEGVIGATGKNARRTVAKRQAIKLINNEVVENSREALRLGAEQAEKIMQSNNYKMGAIVGNSKMLGGITGSIRSYHNPKTGILGAIKQGHLNTKGHIDPFKVAGTTATVGIAGRIVTGGGLYRDKYGNANLPGIPFV